MREVTTADVLDWLGNENSFSLVVEILTLVINGKYTLENIKNEIFMVHPCEEKNRYEDKIYCLVGLARYRYAL